MEQRRTDLALEAAQLWREGGNTGELPGVTQEESTREGYLVTTVKVLDDRGAKAIGKPVGTYVTVDLSALVRREEDAFGRAARAVAAELNALLPVPAFSCRFHPFCPGGARLRRLSRSGRAAGRPALF